jgi:hypothetical protein
VLEHRFTNRQIEAAADALIQEHGNRAVIVAANRAKDLNSGGLNALAELWLKIRERIIVKEQMRRMTS